MNGTYRPCTLTQSGLLTCESVASDSGTQVECGRVSHDRARQVCLRRPQKARALKRKEYHGSFGNFLVIARLVSPVLLEFRPFSKYIVGLLQVHVLVDLVSRQPVASVRLPRSVLFPPEPDHWLLLRLESTFLGFLKVQFRFAMVTFF